MYVNIYMNVIKEKTRTPRVFSSIYIFILLHRVMMKSIEKLYGNKNYFSLIKRIDNHEKKIFSYKVILYPLLPLLVVSLLILQCHHVHENNIDYFFSFFWLFSFHASLYSLMKGIINSWRRDTTTYLSVYSFSPPPSPNLILKNQCEFNDWTYMSQLQRSNRSLNSHISKRKSRKIKIDWA